MSTRKSDNEAILNLRAGEMVEVRSKSEILATLDASGRREALPFMPEMLQHCGKKFRVYKRADKTCDTIRRPVALRMTNAVHLEDVRCDGASHGGCQAGCLLFWKEAWLKPVEVPATEDSIVSGESLARADIPGLTAGTSVCTEDTLLRATRRQTAGIEVDEVFSCQATELPKATSPLAWWDIRQYVRDVSSGNINLVELARGLSISMFNTVIQSIRLCVFGVGHWLAPRPVAHAKDAGVGSESMVAGVGREPMHGFSRHVSPRDEFVEYMKNTLDKLLVEHPHVRGKLTKTPSTVLNLQPGEHVQVKSREEILATLDINNRNRGLLFDVEMVPYCSGTYRVLRRVEKILDERTGKMMRLPNNCIVLDGVVCGGCLSRNRLFCPRSIYPYWHEIWLRRAK